VAKAIYFKDESYAPQDNGKPLTVMSYFARRPYFSGLTCVSASPRTDWPVRTANNSDQLSEIVTVAHIVHPCPLFAARAHEITGMIKPLAAFEHKASAPANHCKVSSLIL
jgi:hypothetical protein